MCARARVNSIWQFYQQYFFRPVTIDNRASTFEIQVLLFLLQKPFYVYLKKNATTSLILS